MLSEAEAGKGGDERGIKNPEQVGNGRAYPKLVVVDRRQAGNWEKQASKAGQEEARSITGRQEGNKGWNDSHVAQTAKSGA